MLVGKTNIILQVGNSMENIRKDVGKRIKELRKLCGLTQEELGEKANLNYKFIGELERGKVNVSLDSLFRIAKALEIHVSDLFRNGKEPILKVTVKEKSPFSKLSPQDLKFIKGTLRLLNRIFSKA
ncbi:MAG TPA: transcriptional regulator [Nitrospiraceae bacterium]|nr:transcriptional regulator [Nitrospiraceae bacterium]